MTEWKNTLSKNERLCSHLLIEKLFSGGSKSFVSFPIRVVYQQVDETAPARASILISVPKKRFKHAVKRNRVKRQIREAYRKNKGILLDMLEAQNKQLILSFIWLDNKLYPSDEVELKVKKLLQLVAEHLEK